jgi:menaquinone-dependent protoporphyrinogen oxidase
LELENMPAAFLSVTLSEAGAERLDATPEQRAQFTAGVQKVVENFLDETGWHPKFIKAIAGALLYSRYNPLVCFVMKRIAKSAGVATDTSRDYEFTDWIVLDHFVGQMIEEISLPAKAH